MVSLSPELVSYFYALLYHLNNHAMRLWELAKDKGWEEISSIWPWDQQRWLVWPQWACSASLINSTQLVYYDLFFLIEYYLFYQPNRLNGLARARCLDLVAECRRRPSLYCSPSARISFGAQLSDLFYFFSTFTKEAQQEKRIDQIKLDSKNKNWKTSTILWC